MNKKKSAPHRKKNKYREKNPRIINKIFLFFCNVSVCCVYKKKSPFANSNKENKRDEKSSIWFIFCRVHFCSMFICMR